LLEDCHFGPYSKDAGRKKEGRPTNEEVGKPLKNEIEIGLRYRELEASGVKTKAERIAILSEEFDRDGTLVRKLLRAYEKNVRDADIEASIDRQSDIFLDEYDEKFWKNNGYKHE
ncbi:MAG: hypothetical protein ABJN78_01880, partial [Hyphomicrobiales bacterium]